MSTWESYNNVTYTDEKPVHLLKQGDSAEVFQYSLHKGRKLYLESNRFKFYFIVYGKLVCSENKVVLEDQMYYSFSDDSEFVTDNILFDVVEDSLILCFFTKTGEYESIVSSEKKLVEFLERIQLKDHYTFTHCERAFELSVILAKKMGYRGRRLRNLIVATHYHDVGKTNIPSKVLNKVEPLTDKEYNLIKGHVKIGYNIIKDNLTEEIADIVYQHHERINGSGYPLGLVGDEIKEEAQLLALIDTYDAMTTDRVYKKAKTRIEAVEELKSLAGILFDSDLIKVFLEVLEENIDVATSTNK